MQRYVSKSKTEVISCETAKTCQDQLSVQTYRVMCCCFLAQTFVLCMFCLTEHLEIIQKSWTADSLEFGYIQWCSTDIHLYIHRMMV